MAVAHCKRGHGLVRVNGAPIETVQPSILRYKVLEPLLLLGQARFANVDIRVRVRGGGYTSQIYGTPRSGKCIGSMLHPSQLALAFFHIIWRLLLVPMPPELFGQVMASHT